MIAGGWGSQGVCNHFFGGSCSECLLAEAFGSNREPRKALEGTGNDCRGGGTPRGLQSFFPWVRSCISECFLANAFRSSGEPRKAPGGTGNYCRGVVSPRVCNHFFGWSLLRVFHVS